MDTPQTVNFCEQENKSGFIKIENYKEFTETLKQIAKEQKAKKKYDKIIEETNDYTLIQNQPEMEEISIDYEIFEED